MRRGERRCGGRPPGAAGRWVPLLCAAALLAAAHPRTCRAAEEGRRAAAYTLGVFPFRPALQLEGIFAPLAAEVGAALGRQVVFKTAGGFERFSEKLAAGDYEIAHIQPFDYVRVAKAAGYLPVADRAEKLFGSFFVPEESPLRSLRELRGRTVALPPEEAAISLLARVALLDAGLRPGRDVTLVHVAEHHSCLQLAAVGKAAACATGPGAARYFALETGRRFRPLEKFPDAPYTVFVVHTRVPAAERELIRRAILATTLEGVSTELRATIAPGGGRPFVPIADEGFDGVRAYWERLGGAR